MLSADAVRDFKKIYQKEYRIKLSDQEAQEKGLQLLNFFKLIYKPIPTNYKKLNTKGVNNKHDR